MATNTTYNIRIDSNVRQEADALFKSMGISMSTAINLFLKQSIIQGRLPFTEVIAEPDYADMLLRDVAQTKADIKNGKATIYSSPDELFASWEDENG